MKKRRGGRGAKRKGSAFERELVHLLQDAGFAAERNPLSGAAYGKTAGFDVSWPFHGKDHKVELKHHGNAFIRLYRWLERVDLLVVRADRSKPLVVMPLDFMIKLLGQTQTTELIGRQRPSLEVRKRINGID